MFTPFESTPLAAVAFGSPPRAAVVYVSSPQAAVIILDHIRPTCLVQNWAPRTTPTLPGVELGLKDNLPPAWCKTGPQGPPPRLKDHCPVLLGIFLVCRRHPRLFTDALDFFVVPSCTSYYCTNRYQECV